MGKLRALEGTLKTWNREVFGDVKIKKKEIPKRIEEIDLKEGEGLMDPALREERDTLRGEYAEVIRKENMNWSQNMKVSWAKEGDCNSAFFHRVASGRRNKNCIGPLVKGNRERTSSD